MATSIRYKIIQEIKDVLEAITKANSYLTNVKYVSDKLTLKQPEEMDGNKLPACFILDEDETKEALALFGGAGEDMTSILTVSITSIVYSKTADTILARTNLIQDIEKAMVTDADLLALLIELPSPISVETDNGYFGNYSVFKQTFECNYIYNHETGGV